MVYHSKYNEAAGAQVVCGCSVLPLSTQARGPAPAAADGAEDVIDETLYYFKANVLFKHFEVKGPADRVLIYLTLYVTQCLRRLEGAPSQLDALKALTTMAHEEFALPGDAAFPLGSFFPAPANAREAEFARAYLRQLREEVGRRLVPKVYDAAGEPSKFWLVYAKRRFLNKSL